MELHKGIQALPMRDVVAWRQWLQQYHRTEKALWLIIYRKESGIDSIYYPEALDEALCYGWIDSLVNKRDEQSYYQYFSQRKPKSRWSLVNKEKVARLEAEGSMTEAGREMVALARRTGTWDALNEVDAVQEPADLADALNAQPVARSCWNAFSRSTRRGILEWILSAQREDTRRKRISETVRLAAINEKANQFPKRPASGQ